MEKLLTVDELADFLQFKKQSIYNLVHNRKIPVVRVGNKLRFKISDIEKYLNTEIKILEKKEN
jgi:excisionase family DNA binding protein